MPPLQQVSTQQAPSFDGPSPLDPAFGDAQVDAYAKRTAPVRKQGLRDLRSYMRSSRGLADSGIEASQVAGLVQSQQGEIGDYASNVGQQQAQAREVERQRQQARGWQVEDRDLGIKQNQEAAAAQERAAQAALWADIAGGVGTVVGGPIAGMAIRQGAKALTPQEMEASMAMDNYAPSQDFMPAGIPEDDQYRAMQAQAAASAARGRR